MIQETSKRPFVRPLFIWIIGIVLELMVSCRLLSVCLLLLSCPILFASLSEKQWTQDSRWIWGILYACLLLFVSIQMTAYREDTLTEIREPYPIQEWAARQQQRLVSSFDSLSLSDTEKSVLATITFGYRQTMSRETKKNFSIAGVSHILAVSGFHVAVVCGFLTLLLSFLPWGRRGRMGKYLLTVGLLWGYAAITGLAASAIRAALMLTLYLTGRVLRRNTDGYNTLAASAFCMLVYNPFYLFDIGFQLSYLAVLSILYIQPRLRKCMEVRNPLLSVPWDWVTMTVAAQMGTALLCLYYFGQFSSVFLFTSLPLTFLSTWLIPLGVLYALLPVWIPGSVYLQEAVEAGVRSMVWVVEAFSHIPGAAFTFQIDFITLLLGYGMLFLVLLSWLKGNPRFWFGALLLLLIILILQLIARFMLCET